MTIQRKTARTEREHYGKQLSLFPSCFYLLTHFWSWQPWFDFVFFFQKFLNQPFSSLRPNIINHLRWPCSAAKSCAKCYFDLPEIESLRTCAFEYLYEELFTCALTKTFLRRNRSAPELGRHLLIRRRNMLPRYQYFSPKCKYRIIELLLRKRSVEELLFCENFSSLKICFSNF